MALGATWQENTHRGRDLYLRTQMKEIFQEASTQWQEMKMRHRTLFPALHSPKEPTIPVHRTVSGEEFENPVFFSATQTKMSRYSWSLLIIWIPWGSISSGLTGKWPWAVKDNSNQHQCTERHTGSDHKGDSTDTWKFNYDCNLSIKRHSTYQPLDWRVNTPNDWY